MAGDVLTRARALLLRPGAGAAGVAVAMIAVSALVTVRLWAAPGSSFAGHNVRDGILYAWWLGHLPHALATGADPLTVTTMNWPDGVGAMGNTSVLLPALLLAPFTALTGPVVALTLLTSLAVPLCAAAGYWAARRIGLGRPGALVAAAAFAGAPAVTNSLVGHVSMALAPALPVLLVLSVQAWSGQRPARTGLALGAVATAQVFTGEEVLFQAGLGALLVALVAAASRPGQVRDGGRRLATALGVAFAVFLPIAGYPLYLQFLGPQAHHGSPFLPDYFGADMAAFTTPTDRQWLHTQAQAALAARFPGGVEEHLAYLGVPLIAVCVWAAVSRWHDLRVRCATVGLATAAALSLGGRLWVRGEWTETPGPFALLQALPVAEASLATRLGLLAAMFAAALLGVVVDAALRSRGGAHPVPARSGLAAALALLCLAPLAARPLPVSAAPDVPEWFASTAAAAAPGEVVLVLPFPDGPDPRGMLWQAAAGYAFSMPGGYFIGPASDGRAFIGGAADPPTVRLLTEVGRDGEPADLTDADRLAADRDLQALGVTTVVLGPHPAADALRATVSDLLGAPPRRVDGVDVWVPGSAS